MLELYHNNISVCAQKVRVVLAEKNVPWTAHHLSFSKGEQLTPEYLKINPRGLVPRATAALSATTGVGI